jgi:NADP-dependent 3-hydroxy acid dehydrogenase YdfG
MLNFSGQVAIVTGAGGGLGREHALALAKRGAKVVVNDLGGSRDGADSGNSAAALAVVAEIQAMGGEAFANGASVTDFAAVQAMVAETIARWGRVDILINNAGILRDKSFAKMDVEDFKFVLDVHLMGSVHCCKAVWPHMQAQNYGRIMMTTSSSGLYGNFGQSNYSAAKIRYPRQRARPYCRHPHDRRLIPRTNAQRHSSFGCRPRHVSSGQPRCPHPSNSVRRRRQFRSCPHQLNARRVLGTRR